MPLKLFRREGTPNIYLRGSVRGQRVFETTGTDDEEAAEAIRIQREGELLQRSVFGASACVTFGQAVISYLTAGGENRFLGTFNAKERKGTLIVGELADDQLSAIDQERVDQVAAKLYPNCGAATLVRQVYSPIAAVLNHAARKKWCARPMISRPRIPKTETTYSTPTRFEQLLPHCMSRNMRLFVHALVYTGERLEKVVFLEWDDIDLTRRVINFGTTKNGKPRTVPIHDALLIELARIPRHRRHGRVFHWKHKTAVHPPLKNACKRAGVEYLPPHQQGRHTFGSWLRIYAGADLKGIMAAANWESERSAMRYMHLAPGETEQAVAKLPSVQNVCTDVSAPIKKRARSR